MDQSEDSNPVKTKKHKKRKKSKKSAITLDEFLSMNQDVFGEDIDFQGVEEVPTRVVKKQLKNNKKTSNSMVTSAELDKLKKAGIVVKKKVSRNPVIKGFPVSSSMPNRSIQNKPVHKINKVREIETSSEVLTKLMNQSNNQIKIVKKVNPNTATELKQVNVPSEEREKVLENMSENPNEPNIEKTSTPIPKSEDYDIPSKTSEQSSVTTSTENLLRNKLKNINSDVVKDTAKNMSNTNEITQKTLDMSDSDQSLRPENNKTCDEENTEDPDGENIETNESDQLHSNTEIEEREIKSASDNCVNNNKVPDGNQEISENNRKHDTVFNASASSLSSLKHLSHLITVKPVSQNRNKLTSEPTSDKIIETSSQHPKDENKETSSVPLATDRASLSKPKIDDKSPTIDALKTISKNITIKSLSTKRSFSESEPEDDEIDMKEKITNNLKLQDLSFSKNITIKKSKNETSDPKPNCKVINSTNNQEKILMLGKQRIVKSPMGKTPNKTIVEKADSLPTSNANILKRLTNITTKPIMNKNTSLPSTDKQVNITKKASETEEKKEEIIEIFDVDDSEDEEENKKQSQPPPQPVQNPKSMDALKNLSKNITIKSMNQQHTVQKNIKIENTVTNVKIEKEENNSQKKFKEESNIDALINLQNRSDVFKNVLQGLCKNITIKSRNTSPSQFPKSEEHNSQDSKVLEDNEASDSDSCPGNVKITELDEKMGDDGENEDDIENTEALNTNLDHPIVESPKESCSENEDEDAQDFETDIKASTVQKSNQTMNSNINSVCLNNLKNINKNITIKSLSKSSTGNDEKSKLAHGTQAHDSQETPHKKQMTPKTSNQIVKQQQNDNMPINRISKNVDHASAQSWNKKVSAMNQVNTVNKEVTVKTIQTKTMIQEITTTVTKTIKTVNQTMKHEVRNNFQTNTAMVTQRIQGIRPSQSKNLQGVVIRHASPMLGARASNTLTQIRPASNIVRPSKQIVPMRTGINLARPNNPRMAVGKKITPTPSPNKPVIGKPLKISPTAMVPTANTKRPNTEDVSGPFSCFKKPKESLIPVSDIPSFVSSEATAQFTSASHTSSSNFTSTTKIVKGNSVMTAKQTNSEVKATSQQLGRFSNKSGVKLMASQQKQSQVQEQQSSESSAQSNPMKRTTLEAIQRLQQQGLLVKKPRVEVTEASEGSDHDGDNNVGYSSADEPDE